MKRLIVIAGPTAVGKTGLAVELAGFFNTEIISCDSRQFYSELSIGVARPTKKELAAVKHHFIACRSIHEPYTAGTFARDAETVAAELFKKNDVVICAGGSGLYLRAWLKGLDDIPSDARIRQGLLEELQFTGLQPLVDELKANDAEYAASADLKNPHRVLRALEVIRATGKKYSEWRTGAIPQRDFQARIIGLNGPKDWLHQRINQRVEEMMHQGLLEEATALYSYRQLQPLRTVGYAELFDAMDGSISLEQAVENIQLHTRQYAKRQITWWNREEGIRWFDATNNQLLDQVVEYING